MVETKFLEIEFKIKNLAWFYNGKKISASKPINLFHFQNIL